MTRTERWAMDAAALMVEERRRASEASGLRPLPWSPWAPCVDCVDRWDGACPRHAVPGPPALPSRPLACAAGDEGPEIEWEEAESP